MSTQEKSVKKKVSKKLISAIVCAALATVFILSLLIVNIFIPVRYLTAYTVSRAERKEGELRITYTSLGMADCTLVELPDGKVMLIDGGDGVYANNLAVLRLLNERSVDKIDYLVCTSVRSEHCGGLEDIVRYKEVGVAFMPYVTNTKIRNAFSRFANACDKKGVREEIIEYGVGDYSENYGYFFAFLSPSDHNSPLSEYVALNDVYSDAAVMNASAVMWLQYGTDAFLFSSDIGEDTLKSLTANYEAFRDYPEIMGKFCPIGNFDVKLEECDVVTVAGHGSSACTYAKWYDLLSPEAAVLSVGENYAGCPSAKALADVHNSTDKIYSTQERGNVTVVSDGNGYRFL